MVKPILGVCIHIMDGSLAGTDSWFKNPTSKVSSHFGVGKDGSTYQWVDTADRAWAQGSGNSRYLSIENEGHGGDELTDAQLTANARILAWAHQTEGVPLQLADSSGAAGLTYHAVFGGHPSCPGSRIIAQRPEIIRRAQQGADDLPYTEAQLREIIRSEIKAQVPALVDEQLTQHGLGKGTPDPAWMDKLVAKIKASS